MTLVDLTYYDDAFQKQREMQDEAMWINGLYTLEALNVVLGNFFAPKGAPPKEYRDTPILTEMREKNRILTEEEKQEQINILFGNLENMQKKFEAAHGDKQNA